MRAGEDNYLARTDDCICEQYTNTVVEMVMELTAQDLKMIRKAGSFSVHHNTWLDTGDRGDIAVYVPVREDGVEAMYTHSMTIPSYVLHPDSRDQKQMKANGSVGSYNVAGQTLLAFLKPGDAIEARFSATRPLDDVPVYLEEFSIDVLRGEKSYRFNIETEVRRTDARYHMVQYLPVAQEVNS